MTGEQKRDHIDASGNPTVECICTKSTVYLPVEVIDGCKLGLLVHGQILNECNTVEPEEETHEYLKNATIIVMSFLIGTTKSLNIYKAE